MSTFRRDGRCFMVTAFLGVWAMEANATVLLFDQIRELGVVTPTISGNNVPQDYGDRVAGALQSVPGGQFTYGEAGEGFTPNVVADYFVSSAAGPNGVSLWQDSYGDLTNVAFGNQNSITLNVRLTADSGFRAVLHHFDLGGWPNADHTINAVRVLDGSDVLFSQSNVRVEGDFSGPRRTSFDFVSPLAGAELLIEVDYSNLPGNQQDNIGIDNIRFGQDPPVAIPEPAAGLLLSLGLPFLCLWCRYNWRSGGMCGRS